LFSPKGKQSVKKLTFGRPLAKKDQWLVVVRAIWWDYYRVLSPFGIWFCGKLLSGTLKFHFVTFNLPNCFGGKWKFQLFSPLVFLLAVRSLWGLRFVSFSWDA